MVSVAVMAGHDVSIAGGVSGTWTDAAARGPAPSVVMLHGFGGHRNEVGGMFAKLAARLSERGIASLRIDFPGCGKSSGTFADITTSLYRRAAIAALRFAKSAPDADPKCLGLLGYSFGAAIATTCLGADAPRPRALVLWAPVGYPRVDMVESIGASFAAEADRAGSVAVPWGKGEIRLKRAFFRSLADMAPIKAVADFQGSVFVAAGSQDRLAKYVGEIYSAAQRAHRCEQRMIDGADHFFCATDANAGFADALIADTVQFFASTLRGG